MRNRLGNVVWGNTPADETMLVLDTGRLQVLGNQFMSRTRRCFTAEQKVQIVRLHLAGKEAVSALAEEFSLQPSQIHTWVHIVLAQADKALTRSAENGRTEKAQAQRIEWDAAAMKAVNCSAVETCLNRTP